jgi:hyperosmotically inducible protein
MVQGVKEVENNLEVLPLSPFDSAVRRQIAMAIYGNPIFSRYAIQALPPIHIVVKNGNVTLVGYVHDEVEKAMAYSAARFAATYFDLKNQLIVETAQAKANR